MQWQPKLSGMRWDWRALLRRRTWWRLLRRRPLHVISAIAFVIAVGAISLASAAGLRMVEPHAQSYPVSLLSVLYADYRPWSDANARRARLDEAIIADAARDEVLRSVTPPPGGSSLVPLDLPPLPQAAAVDGQSVAWVPTSQLPSAEPTLTATRDAAASPTNPARSPTTARPVTQAPATAKPVEPSTVPATSPAPPTAAPPVVLPTLVPVPPTAVPPTQVPPTQVPSEVPTEMIVPPFPQPPTTEPPTPAPATEPPRPTSQPRPTRVPPSRTAVPPTASNTVVPPTAVPPTAVPPTAVPPTAVPPTAVPPTAVPPTPVPPTQVPPTDTPVPLPTDTPVPPTPTPTDTPVPPTDTPVPPTETPVPPTPTPTDTPVPPPTDTPVPPSLVVQIVAPANGATITNINQTRFEAIAYDPSIGTGNGNGITNVSFSIVQLTGGSYSHSRTEGAPAYCAFSGDGPCSTATNWAAMTPGTYRLTVTATAPGKPSVTVSVEFTVA